MAGTLPPKEWNGENGHGTTGPVAEAVVRALESGGTGAEADGNVEGGANGNDGESAPEKDDEDEFKLLKYPLGKSAFTQFSWIITWPIHLLFMFTIPNCETPRFRNWFPLTFIMCIVWIGSLSYVVAWMITIIGRFLMLFFTKVGKFLWNIPGKTTRCYIGIRVYIKEKGYRIGNHGQDN